MALIAADFFQRWKSGDGEERRIPHCKRHSGGKTHYVGAVLWALHYGVVEDLRFWTQQDPLPGGLSGCDFRYYAMDPLGDSKRAGCTNDATTRVRVTEPGSGGKVYDGNCATPAPNASRKKPMQFILEPGVSLLLSIWNFHTFMYEFFSRRHYRS